ncbi:MAG: 2,3-bisphosphoglycerate-independent phosphoglycerate mutase [Gemmatimonadales bacterium]|nr:MAG: 2,3-bisphosphoglycerate-independent phosphoglycerate mutase [Gemmatimonadales bacterium]
MTLPTFPDSLVQRGADGRILLLVLDGVGGLPGDEQGRTELEAARTPNLDQLAAESSLGMHHPVAPGVTPGSGPGHLSLFGYDPLVHQVGRGALSALGVGFELLPGDLALRLNLATLDEEGRIVDRRAGRPSDEDALRIVRRLRDGVRLRSERTEFFLLPEKEHRVVLIFRGGRLGEKLRETDPQEVGVPPRTPKAFRPDPDPASETTVRVLRDFLEQAREILKEEPVMNGLLARGYARYEGFPSFEDRFGLRGAVHARYPMYRGVARLVGMEVTGAPSTDEEAVGLVERHFGEYDFHFLHYKAPDARGEDGDFEGKVKALEAADAWIPRLRALEPDVIVVTGDHSTPATMKIHSWHAVPLLIHSRWARPTAGAFGEGTCRGGDLGTIEGRHIMSLALAHAGRLRKFGA